MNNAERTKLWVEANKKICPSCGHEMYYRSKTCKKCSRNSEKSEKIKDMTLGEYRDKSRKKGVHPSWVNAEIRNFARTWNRNMQSLPCQVCGYSLHVELCHKIALKDLPDDTKLGVANSEDNLMVLCPNCHWEYDNGIISA